MYKAIHIILYIHTINKMELKPWEHIPTRSAARFYGIGARIDFLGNKGLTTSIPYRISILMLS